MQRLRSSGTVQLVILPDGTSTFSSSVFLLSKFSQLPNRNKATIFQVMKRDHIARRKTKLDPMGRGGQNYKKGESPNPIPISKADHAFLAWSRDAKECEDAFQVSRDSGLSSEEVDNRRKVYGWNELEKHKDRSMWKLLLDQLSDTLVRILLAAAIISFVLAWFDGEEEKEITAFVEPLVIFLILIVNAIVGIWQESNAEKALEALKEIQSEQAAVIRDGRNVSNLAAKELVPGNIVEPNLNPTNPNPPANLIDRFTNCSKLERGLVGEVWTGLDLSSWTDLGPLSWIGSISQISRSLLW